MINNCCCCLPTPLTLISGVAETINFGTQGRFFPFLGQLHFACMLCVLRH